MSMTIDFGWWTVPAAITLAAFFVAFLANPSGAPRGYDDLANAVIGLVFYAAATIVSLVAWLIWAVLT